MKLRRTWWFLRRWRGQPCCGCGCWPWEPARPSRRPFPALSVSVSRLPPQNRGSCAGSQPWPPEWQSESHLRREREKESEVDDACGRQQQLLGPTQRVLTTNTCCNVAIMVPRDGSSLKKTNTAHGVGEARRGEARKRGEGERRRAGREAKPRESVANQALACLPSSSFLPSPTQPCVQLCASHTPPLHVTAPRHPQYFLQSELDGAMSIDSTHWRSDSRSQP